MSAYIKDLFNDIHNIIDTARRNRAILSAFIVPEPLMAELHLAMDHNYGTRNTSTTLQTMQQQKELNTAKKYDDVSFISVPNLKALHCVINGEMLSASYVLSVMKEQCGGIENGKENSRRLGKKPDQIDSRKASISLLDEDH